MASKYGNQLYGMDLYSSAFALLEGTFSVVPDLAGRLVESEPLEGTLVLTFPINAWFTESEVLEAQELAINFPMSGIIQHTRIYEGNLYFEPLLEGILFRSGARNYESHLVISVGLEGHLGVSRPFETAWILSIDISGGADIYLGPFWKPDEPVETIWEPDTTSGNIWTPNAPERQWHG